MWLQLDFSLCFLFPSLLLILSIYIRHIQINFHFEHNKRPNRSTALWNNVATSFGVASTFGLLLVANFQEDNDYPVHYTGAAVCIWGGSIYFMFQTFISHLMRSYLCTMSLHYTRVMLSTFTVMFNVIGVVSTVTAIKHAPQGMPQKETVSDWSPDDPYWVAHVLSVTSEWILAFIQSATVLTFVPELRRMKVVFPKLKIEDISPDD
ncbi:DNA damage-regulated autophagy modulator protein 2-like isoform X2 [Macrosteles quadrilineatus]|uniref:DNA damage-regulated autophagy modulator protein 2-like isoform X2 n=1 Tax=Macrosteles quadrilineatus TaxID=74068 RepID=UPI0023E27D8D|nr:DNA damage-regulated autophagy modulator protein 2-like isoform X2 [Macrosteles quadrilineatus]